MDELIKVTTSAQGAQVVSARELYDFLKVRERFSKWFDRQISFGFELNKDYTPYQMVHPKNFQENTDYALTIDTAKEISMIQRSEKGKQARLYFIECEKQLQNRQKLLPSNFKEALLSLLEAEEEKERLASQVELQEKELIKQAPKVEYFNTVMQSESLIPTNVIAKELGMSAVTLNRLLKDKRIIYESGGTYVLFAKYQNLGYTGTKTTSYTDSKGNAKTAVHTYWSEKGRAFIHSIFSRILPVTNQKNNNHASS